MRCSRPPSAPPPPDFILRDFPAKTSPASSSGPRPTVPAMWSGKRIVGLVEEAGWAELVAVRTDRMTTLPDQVGFDVAATVPIAGLTALRTLRLGGDLAGRNVLVTAANGAAWIRMRIPFRRRVGLTAVCSSVRRCSLLRGCVFACANAPGRTRTGPSCGVGTSDLKPADVGV